MKVFPFICQADPGLVHPETIESLDLGEGVPVLLRNLPTTTQHFPNPTVVVVVVIEWMSKDSWGSRLS